MKKRILSILLAALMIISVLPAYALADNEPLAPTDATAERTTVVSAASGAVHVNKSISNDGTELTLEAYLTNEVTQTVSAKPLDIVLVLDQSGSMAYDFNGNTTSNNANRRQYAMKQAVNAFIGKVNEQYSTEGDHQMAIVTFGTNAKQLKGWTAVDDSGKTALTDAINGLPQTPSGATDVGAGMQEAQTLMNSAKSGTDRQKVVIVFTDGVPTRPDKWGNATEFRTDVANEAISAAKAMKAAGTVVYTVGIFNGANPAQLHGNAVVTAMFGSYPCTGTVGQIWGATGMGKNYAGNDFVSEDIPAGNRFLNYLSSNFKSATEIGIQSGSFSKHDVQGYQWGDHPLWQQDVQGYKITKNFTRNDSNFYLKAGSANELSGVFQTIVSEISKLDIVAGTDTILSDTLSQYFTLNVPANTEAKNAITVEKWDCTGKNASGYTWVKATTQPTTLNVEVTAEKTIKVTGFDYTENAVTETVKEGNPTYSGSKLVVTIPIKPDTSCTDWQHGAHDYPTNDIADNKAGLSGYKDKEGKDVGPTQLNQSPEAPVTGYKVTYRVTSADNPDDYTEVKDDTVYLKGQTATVKPAPNTNSTSNGNEQGEWDFIGWKNGENDAGTEITINDNVTLTGEWKFTKADKYGVTYTYVSSDPTNHPLPDAINTPNGTGDYAVSDSKTYYVDATVTRQNPTSSTYTDTTNHGTWNLTWDRDSAIMTANGVTFTGTWTFVEDGKFSVTYRFNGEAPDDAIEPTISKMFYANDRHKVAVMQFSNETKNDAGETGEWTFNGWTLNGKDVTGEVITIAGNTEIVGTWTFTKKDTEPPVGETYDVSLTITKTVKNVHGTAPDETYNFVVYYKDAAGNPVYLRDKDHPLTISLAAGEDSKEKDFTIKMTQTQLNNWPETLVTEGIYEGRVRFVYVEEIDGGTDHMTYAKAPVRGQFVGIAISSMRSVTKYFLYSEQNWQGIFSFTNVYNKTTGRDVTPAKVSPQLNRDDHVAYIMGYPDGNVRPEGEITRAEACTIFFRLLTKESRDYYFSRTNDYTDVSRTDWFNNAISTLSNAGIVTGYADGTFRPDQPITRGEMAKIIANFARLGGATKSFTDLSGHWAKSYVELAAGNGWIAGYPDGTFGPDKKITRAETVTMINRVLERVPAKESRLLSRSVMLTFPDNEPGEWYYIAVQEASNSHTYQRSAYETAGDEMWLRLIENVDWTKLEK